MPRLVFRIEEAGHAPREVFVRADLTIGRHPECDVVLTDGKVSSRHARVVAGPDGTFAIEDLGSANKTSVNNGPVLSKGQSHPLTAGVRLLLGATNIDVVEAVATSAPTQAMPTIMNLPAPAPVAPPAPAPTPAKAEAPAPPKIEAAAAPAPAPAPSTKPEPPAVKIDPPAPKAEAPAPKIEPPAPKPEPAAPKAEVPAPPAPTPSAPPAPAPSPAAAAPVVPVEPKPAPSAPKPAPPPAAAPAPKPAAPAAPALARPTPPPPAQNFTDSERAEADAPTVFRMAPKPAAEPAAAAPKPAEPAPAPPKPVPPKATPPQPAPKPAPKDIAEAEAPTIARPSPKPAAAASPSPEPAATPAKPKEAPKVSDPEPESTYQATKAINVAEFSPFAIAGQLIERRPRFLVVDDAVRRAYKMGFMQVVMGRRKESKPPHPSANLVVDHQSVSSPHSMVFFDRGHFFIKDLESKNGTQASGETLGKGAAKELKAETLIKLGGLDIFFTVDKEADGREYPKARINTAVQLLVQAGRPTQSQLQACQAKVAEARGRRERGEVPAPAEKDMCSPMQLDELHMGEVLMHEGIITVEMWLDALRRAEIVEVAGTSVGQKGGNKNVLVLLLVFLFLAAVGVAAFVLFFKK